MRQLSIEEVKKIELEITEDIARFCEENNIDYFLCGGSMLGAIRHKGYIPWDDDIDIGMTRENYEKFVHSYKSEKYQLCYTGGEEDFYLPFAKIYDKRTILTGITDYGCDMGVWADVLPIDNVPSDEAKMKKFVSKMIKKRYFIVAATAGDISKRKFTSRVYIRLVRIIKKLFGIKNINLVKKFIAEAQKYNNVETDKSGCVVWGYGMGEICPKYVYENTTLAPFEHLNLRVLTHYDTYLSGIYGDYMKLPPIEQQVLKHGDNTFYMKDECESE